MADGNSRPAAKASSLVVQDMLELSVLISKLNQEAS